MRECMSELRDLLKANMQVIWVNTYEETEFISDLKELMLANFPQFKLQTWSANAGLQVLPLDNAQEIEPPDPAYRDPHRVFATVASAQSASLEEPNCNFWLMKDLHVQLEGVKTVTRAIRDAKEVKRTNHYNPIIIVSPTTYIPMELEKMVHVIDYDIPSRHFLKNFMNQTLMGLRAKQQSNPHLVVPGADQVEPLVNAVVGLTFREVRECISKSLIKNGTINPEMILEQKIQLIRKTGVLGYEIPNVRLQDIGGNEEFKEWVEEVRLSFTEEAAAFGCERSKGYLALGIPGCAKTLLARALATEMNMPLIKLDMSKIMDKLVGQSEKKIEQAFRVVKACAPCIMLWDEVEKILGGIQSSNSSDSGATARVFASCLNFLQENNNVFVVMTSNDISQLPPEFTRRGRLDEIWYFSLPTKAEREQIFEIHLNKTGKSYNKDCLHVLADAAENFTGAEIESVVKASLWKAFKRFKTDGVNRITEEDLIAAIDDTVPLYESSRESIIRLEEWAKGRARYSSRQYDENGFAVDETEQLAKNIIEIQI